jgi:hypothetical protein
MKTIRVSNKVVGGKLKTASKPELVKPVTLMLLETPKKYVSFK